MNFISHPRGKWVLSHCVAYRSWWNQSLRCQCANDWHWVAAAENQRCQSDTWPCWRQSGRCSDTLMPWRHYGGQTTVCLHTLFNTLNININTARWRRKQREALESHLNTFIKLNHNFCEWSWINFTCWQQNHKMAKKKGNKKSNRLERRQAVSYSSACGSSSRGGKTHWLMNKTTWRVYNPPGSRWQVREIPAGSGQTSHIPSHSPENMINSTNQPCSSPRRPFFSLFLIFPWNCSSDYCRFEGNKTHWFITLGVFHVSTFFHGLVFLSVLFWNQIVVIYLHLTSFFF